MKKRIWIIALVGLIITLFVIVDTFALFETNGTATTEFEIGKWKIYVNEADISVSQAIVLNDFQYSDTIHTADGYFAPGRSAIFDVDIDTSESDVSVDYVLTIDDSSIEDYDNIYFSIKNMETNQEITSNTYSGTINLNDVNRDITLRISLVWDDDPDYDESDSTLIGTNMQFVINANFSQHVGV